MIDKKKFGKKNWMKLKNQMKTEKNTIQLTCLNLKIK